MPIASKYKVDFEVASSKALLSTGVSSVRIIDAGTNSTGTDKRRDYSVQALMVTRTKSDYKNNDWIQKQSMEDHQAR